MRLSLYLSVDCGSIIMGNSCWLRWFEDFTVCSCCQFWHAVIMVYICWRFCYRVIMLYRCWIYTFTWTSWCGSVTNPMLAYVVMAFSLWESCYVTVCQGILQGFYNIQLPERLMQFIMLYKVIGAYSCLMELMIHTMLLSFYGTNKKSGIGTQNRPFWLPV